MSIFFKNTSKTKSISLRYGDGNNNMIQLKPGQQQPIPSIFNKQKLQSYLRLFKDLKIVEELEEIKEENNDITGEVNGDSIKDNSESQLSTPDDTSGEQQDNLNSQDDNQQTENQEGNNDPVVNGPVEGEQPENQEGDNDPVINGSVEGEQTENRNTEDQEKDKLPIYTEKELNKLSAGEIKEIAKKLGIEVTEDSTKKALIPVILNKQGKLE